ncbi:cytochrome P450 6a2-like [Condylostylus longicornis]|uniref:cytochrome P450 6a2-like n=1 Tax=Condylostylus longicornis TaxID=2530218 RepID=UPI00244DD470|nr:cytochrome P450 6a2-like [Condylostylus longicornis]
MDIEKCFNYTIIYIATFLYGVFTNKRKYWEKRSTPHHYLEFHRTMHPSQKMKEFYDKEKGKFSFVGMYFFTNPFALILDIDLAKNILVKDFQNFIDRGVYYNEKDDPLSAHLFSLDGQKWKKLRHKLTPTFTSGKMIFMFSTIVKVGEEFQETLRELIKENDIIEMKELLGRFTTDVIGTCAFGIECNSLKDPNAEFLHMAKTAFEKPKSTAFVFTFKKQAKLLRITTTRKDVGDFFLGVVREKMEHRIKYNIKSNDFMG